MVDLAKGNQTAKFDIHNKGVRKFEHLGIKWKKNPKTIQEQNEKREKLKLVQILANKREMDLLQDKYEIEAEYDLNTDFVAYMDKFIAYHQIKEIKKFYAAQRMFLHFIKREEINCCEITEALLRRFVQFLEQRLKGESPSNYFAKLKQIIKAATSDNHFRRNPAENIKVKKTQFLHKEVLNFTEIKRLSETPLKNSEVKNAFLFCCLTGLRFCDANVLRWGNVFSDKIKIVQEKTKVPLTIPLSQDALDLLPSRRNYDDLVFTLPSHTACQKWLKRWMQDAEIEKHISWHCGRHSFGTNLIAHGVDVSIASKLLGHTSLANTQRYVRVNDEMKASAISKFPSISNN
ncbi:MAG: site-specific integrase [Bacteroidetes bacterium]|nr:site-specific integrase [Bacteroidota bacterium]